MVRKCFGDYRNQNRCRLCYDGVRCYNWKYGNTEEGQHVIEQIKLKREIKELRRLQGEGKQFVEEEKIKKKPIKQKKRIVELMDEGINASKKNK